MTNTTIQFIKNIVIYSVGALGSKLIAFFLLPLYTHTLPRKDFGFIELINTTLMVAIPIIGFQLSESAFRYLLDSKDLDDKKKIISNSFFIVITSCVVFGILYKIASLFTNITELFQNKGNLIMLLIFTTLWVGILKQIARGLEENIVFAFADIILTVSIGGLSYYFLYIKNWGLSGYFLSIILSNTFVILIIIIFCRLWRFIRISSISKSQTYLMLLYSIPFIPNIIAGWFMNASDRYFIAHYAGLNYVGLYSVAFKYSTILTILSGIIILAWQSYAVTNYHSRNANNSFSRIFELYLFSLTLIFMVLIIIEKPLLKIMVSEEYINSWRYIPLLLGSSYALAMSSFFAVAYIVVKKTKNLFYSSILTGATNVILNLIFIPECGAIAAAYSTLFSTIILWIIRMIDTKKYFNIYINYKSIILNIIIIISIVFLELWKLEAWIDFIIKTVFIFIFLFFNKFVIKRLLDYCLYLVKIKITKVSNT
ncbi:lipopolysaccharide biosynthesis protein [Bacillus smithii]|uniref:Uncharacterized protein n=1 Tax=Bacillus smithii 7_3_47FAA TaxID=665952 RepID=G9QJM3_9BACI|nr:oligosaccharide flippase family protein [Bacillus smithii]EHL78621.1 hypothetical protein HMPREF1015_01906 [Bacillus smithii 7_3_47FAA]